jgi:hypothetical protein
LVAVIEQIVNKASSRLAPVTVQAAEAKWIPTAFGWKDNIELIHFLKLDIKAISTKNCQTMTSSTHAV